MAGCAYAFGRRESGWPLAMVKHDGASGKYDAFELLRGRGTERIEKPAGRFDTIEAAERWMASLGCVWSARAEYGQNGAVNKVNYYIGPLVVHEQKRAELVGTEEKPLREAQRAQRERREGAEK